MKSSKQKPNDALVPLRKVLYIRFLSKPDILYKLLSHDAETDDVLLALMKPLQSNIGIFRLRPYQIDTTGYPVIDGGVAGFTCFATGVHRPKQLRGLYWRMETFNPGSVSAKERPSITNRHWYTFLHCLKKSLPDWEIKFSGETFETIKQKGK